MLRLSKAVTAGIVTGAVLLGGAPQSAAQTVTTTTTRPSTTTSTSTSTTVPPHPFSDATDACVRAARSDFKACRRGGGSTCRTDFETAFSQCFAAGAGVSCAKRCVTRETTCLTAVPTTQKSCRKSCRTAARRDVRACKRIAEGDTIWAGGDAGCLTTAQSNYDLCRFVCTQARADCHTSLRFCVANCANL
jgi:hypothetical protein